MRGRRSNIFSNLDILGEELGLLDEAALLENHLVDFELGHVINGAHPVVYFLLALSLKRAVHSVVVSNGILFVEVGIIKLLVKDAAKGHARVELDPGRSEHEVDVALELVAPELDHPPQVELADHVVRLNQRVHVGLETMLSVDAFLVELDFDEAIGVGADDEIDFGPVDHDDLLHVVHNIR